MAELYLFKHTDEEILKRVENINWWEFLIPKEKLLQANLISLRDYTKFKKIFDGLTRMGANEANNSTRPLLIYDGGYTSITKNDNIKDFYYNCVNLDERMKEIFFIRETLLNINNWFSFIDNDGPKKIILGGVIVELPDLDILKSKGLRAFKYKMIESFYNDLVKFFLNLVMDYYYCPYDFYFSGLTIEQAALNAARIILPAKKIYEQQLMKEWGGDAIIDKLENELSTKPEKTKTNKKTKKNKKSEIKITE